MRLTWRCNLGKPGGDDEVMIDINTTPLIDVMLVLLIMLIITIPVQTHAVKLDMPRDNRAARTVQPEVDQSRHRLRRHHLWNGNVVPDRATLENYLHAAARQDPQPEIHLAPNKLVKYSYVAMVWPRRSGWAW